MLELHTQECIEALKYMASVPIPSVAALKLVSLPKSNLKLCIFDLDETLIHSVDDIHTEPFQILIKVHEGEPNNYNSIGVNIRPFAQSCLSNLKQHY